MGLFFQTISKFAGFAHEESAIATIAAKTSEAALSFIHTEEKGFKQIALMKGEQKIGQLKYKEFGTGYTVTGIVGEEKGAGMQMRTELARRAQAEGKEFLISDVYGSMSFDEGESWQRLKRQGQNVSEVQVPNTELGLNRTGTKFAYKWSLDTKVAEATANRSLKAGQGNSNTSLLNRSLRTHQGSRKTSAAL